MDLNQSDLIPVVLFTYNKPAKLRRVLASYMHWSTDLAIYVLDGSDINSCEINKKICENFSFVEYFDFPNTLPPLRYLKWLESFRCPTIFFVASDEDPYIESFCKKAFKNMKDDKSISTVVGSYVTILRPFVIAPQVSLDKFVPVDMFLRGSLEEKLSTFLQLNVTGKIPPLFWGVKRIDCFVEYCRLVMDFTERGFCYSTMERLEQMLLIKNGIIKFVSSPMLIRDETRIQYKPAAARHDPDRYLPKEEHEFIMNILFPNGTDLKHLGESQLYPALYSVTNDKRIGLSLMTSYQVRQTQLIHVASPILRYSFRLLQAIEIRVRHFVSFLLIVLGFVRLGNAKSFFLAACMNPYKSHAK